MEKYSRNFIMNKYNGFQDYKLYHHIFNLGSSSYIFNNKGSSTFIDNSNPKGINVDEGHKIDKINTNMCFSIFNYISILQKHQ